MTSRNWIDARYISTIWSAPGVEVMYFCLCISFYIYRFYNVYFIFSSFLHLYSQFSLYFEVFSSFCIFRVYFFSILWSFLFFPNSQFFYLYPYIFAGFLYLSYFSGFFSQQWCWRSDAFCRDEFIISIKIYSEQNVLNKLY